MSKTRLAVLTSLGSLIALAAIARADDISAKKMSIKDNANAAKRQVQVQSADPGVQFSDAVDPAANGATLHVYSATDDQCFTLSAGANWVNKKNKTWKYKSKATKNSAQLKDGKLLVIIKSGVTYSLADDGTQGTVNAQARFGAGTRFCMRCTGNKKDEALKFLAKDCVAAPCDPEPPGCGTVATTTSSTTLGTSTTTSTSLATPTTTSTSLATPSTTSTSLSTPTTSTSLAPTTTSTSLPPTTTSSTVTTTSTSTTSTTPSGGVVLKGALTATPGRFNYNLTLGLPGANAACNTNFAGTHACSYQELQNAAAAGDLDGLKDTAAVTVTSFWAIDSNVSALQQCIDDAAGGSNLNWEYGTAHTVSRGQKVPLDNAAGTLGALQTGLQCNFSGDSWVGCCQ